MKNKPAAASKHASKPAPLKPIENSKELVNALKGLTKEFKSSNSFRNRFLMALITGFGTVIGATVLIALLIFILTQLAHVDVIRPFVQNIVDIVQTPKS